MRIPSFQLPAHSPSKSPVSQPPKLPHLLPPIPNRPVTSSTSLQPTSPRPRSPETPGSDFDRALEELDSTVGNNTSRPLSQNQGDGDGQGPPSSSSSSSSSLVASDNDFLSGNEYGNTVKDEAVVKSDSEALSAKFQVHRSGVNQFHL
ncbi:hypothetical protein ACJ73_01404 [Blastomyces percursus]|uniref:Uncharacterized protein n=1 Tax=Blastomyces percursus TaxID=1658174 RepID=A0A1J9RF42_9EURO|nr:hypothetical protein ACJ73_01404 [Blastomyces percursus]